MQPVDSLTRIMDLEWVVVTLDAMVARGLLDAEDGDDQAVKDYQSFHELQEACDKLIAAHPYEPEFQLKMKTLGSRQRTSPHVHSTG